MTRQLAAKLEVVIIVLLACVPLFIHLPYRVNIFLSWEGAYRMSEGQRPFRDFGVPLGGMYWVIPAVFFKLFGAKMVTLIKAQVFINILSGLAFRSILSSLNTPKGIRMAAVLLYVLSYSFFNFWPWYNQSVIVYEIVGLAFLFRWIRAEEGEKGRYSWAWLAGAGLFTACSFLTKQDGGGLAFFLSAGILAVYGLLKKRILPVVVFGVSFVVFLLLLIAPYLAHGFGYWFNHGQAPHSSRVSPFDIAAEFFGASQWIKFYCFVILLLAVARWRSSSVSGFIQRLRGDVLATLFVVLAFGILVEAAVLQVTSYTPPDGNIFFHSFAFAVIFTLLAPMLPIRTERPAIAALLMAGILLWWSGVWWKYAQRLTGPFLSKTSNVSPTGENVINKDTYMINHDSTTDIPTEYWVESDLPSFHKITMPAPTVEGIRRFMNMDLIKKYREGRQPGQAPGDLKVLNMSELTPLAAEVPFALEKNQQLPLWYHLGVGMFNRQADTFETRIRDKYYDLVLFEYVPNLNNFYPFRTRDVLHQNYLQVDSFMAPRRGPESQGWIEVFVRPAALSGK